MKVCFLTISTGVRKISIKVAKFFNHPLTPSVFLPHASIWRTYHQRGEVAKEIYGLGFLRSSFKVDQWTYKEGDKEQWYTNLVPIAVPKKLLINVFINSKTLFLDVIFCSSWCDVIFFTFFLSRHSINAFRHAWYGILGYGPTILLVTVRAFLETVRLLIYPGNL